jgi:hypothetical protein
MKSDHHTRYTIDYSTTSRVFSTPRLMNGVATLGTALFLLCSNSVSAGQLISATKLIIVEDQDTTIEYQAGNELEAIGGTRAKAIGGTRAKAIGGTRAKAIGGTRAKAIGGTRAKAIGGTRAQAIGGTRAKAIGGTRAKAIGGTRAKAIGGTRLLAIADTQVRSLGAAQLANSVHQLGILNQFESAPVSFMGEEYDWIVIGPVQHTAQGGASVLGYNVDIGDQAQSLFNDQTMVVVGNRHDDGSTIALATEDAFVSGVTEVLTAARIKDINASVSQLTLTSGIVVDYTQILTNQDQPEVHQGDFVFVQGHLY